jgi:hypothetical protein
MPDGLQFVYISRRIGIQAAEAWVQPGYYITF